jgi:hypothetical protein
MQAYGMTGTHCERPSINVSVTLLEENVDNEVQVR